MNRLTEAADRYLRDCTWKDISILKFCLIALGGAAGHRRARSEEKGLRLGGGAGVRGHLCAADGQVSALSAGRAGD